MERLKEKLEQLERITNNCESMRVPHTEMRTLENAKRQENFKNDWLMHNKLVADDNFDGVLDVYKITKDKYEELLIGAISLHQSCAETHRENAEDTDSSEKTRKYHLGEAKVDDATVETYIAQLKESHMTPYIDRIPSKL